MPAAKITQVIADARGLGDGPWTKDCASPPSHSAFSSPLGLLNFVEKLRTLSNGKPIGFKICIGQPEEFAAIVAAMVESKILPDFITVDGAEGGTGAAPPEFQDSMGFPMAEGLRLVDSFLTGAGIRSEIKLIAAGKIYNGFSLVRTLANGADATNAARSFMFSLGCIQALKCNSNNCPTGITTQREDLNSGLDVEIKSIRVNNFHKATVLSASEIIGAMGKVDASEVNQKDLYKRENGIHISNYEEMHSKYFPMLESGCLIEEGRNVPTKYAEWWESGKKIHQKMK